jgi:hypothetical protein
MSSDRPTGSCASRCLARMIPTDASGTERGHEVNRPVRAAALLIVGCSLTVGCGSPVAGPNSVSAHEYVACTSALGCSVGSQMKTESSVMYLSGDGTLFVKDIRWHHWGSSTATGDGTAEVGNCKPNCAQGTFSGHPATIVLSDPEPWHSKMAYSHEVDAVPAIGWHYTFSHGLIPGATTPATRPTPSPSSVPPSAPLTATCLLGYDSGGTLLPATAANAAATSSDTAELVTLTNSGSGGVTVAAIETESTWHGQVIVRHTIDLGTPQFIAPGESYKTLIQFQFLGSTVDVSENTYLHSTCSVVTWYSRVG